MEGWKKESGEMMADPNANDVYISVRFRSPQYILKN
jgi:hypothetical protein